MAIKIILSAGLLFVLLYAVAQRVTSRLLTFVLVIVGCLGIYFVWLPDHTTIVAEMLGVGRGADLLLYLWILVSLIVGLNLHLKIRDNGNRITELARNQALNRAHRPDEHGSEAENQRRDC